MTRGSSVFPLLFALSTVASGARTVSQTDVNENLPKRLRNFDKIFTLPRRLSSSVSGSGSGSGSGSWSGSGSDSGSGSGSGSGSYATPAQTKAEAANNNDAVSSLSVNRKPAGGGLTAGASNIQYKVSPELEDDVSTCGGSKTFFADVLVEHYLEDAEDLPGSLLKQMEDIFRDTYNSLNTPRTNQAVCDAGKLRYVDKVEVFAKDNIYRQLDGQKLARRNFFYRVTAKCINCDKEATTIFDTAPHRKEVAIIALMDDAESTTCTCSAKNDNRRAPTEVEFRNAFRKNIKGLVAEGSLMNIKTADKVVEYDVVDCKGGDDKFETEVYVDLSEEPEVESIPHLENGFLNSYNKLAVSFCDPEHHFIEQVDMEDHVRFLEEVVVKKKKRRRKFRVKGRCRGCKSLSGLFNDAVDAVTKTDGTKRNLRAGGEGGRRRAIRSYGGFDFRHTKKDGMDECFCAARPLARRAPNEVEVRDSFNNILIQGNKRGYVKQAIVAEEVSSAGESSS